MNSDVTVVLTSDLLLRGPAHDRTAVAVLAPLSGIMGVAGPSVVNCALLAAEEVSSSTGRAIDLVLVNAGSDPSVVAAEVDALVTGGLVSGLAGTHPSDVREAVDRAVHGRVPYVFTPPHEHPLSDHAARYLGVGPLEQVLGPIRWLGAHRQVRRWALIGNDYVWPRQMHRAAAGALVALRYEVVLDTLVPIGEVDTQRLVGAAERAGADALLVSLIGRDGITFQRDFADSASRPLIRLYTAFDENSLVASGGDASGSAFATLPSFVLQSDDRHLRLMEAYVGRFGVNAPVPSAYAVSAYEGMLTLATLCTSGMVEAGSRLTADGRAMLRSARRTSPQLAWADDNQFRVIENLDRV